MIKFLISLKRRFPALWQIIEFPNRIFFRIFFFNRIHKNAIKNLNIFSDGKYSYRFIGKEDIESLFAFFQNQNMEQFNFFNPHPFDKRSLFQFYSNPSFYMFGVFNDENLIGYFFLRCFLNKKCFTGRIVDERFQGQGIAKRMGKILHHIAWDSNFRVFGTASKNNIKSLKSYQAINNINIIKELDNGYIYFEYLKSEEKPL